MRDIRTGLVVFVMAELFVLCSFNPLYISWMIRNQDEAWGDLARWRGKTYSPRDDKAIARRWSPWLLSLGTLAALAIAVWVATMPPQAPRLSEVQRGRTGR